MTEKLEFNPTKGFCERKIRTDAVKLRDPDRWYVPNTEDMGWVSNMDEFRAAGGTINFNEDQTEIELLLPEGYKFSIQMFRSHSRPMTDHLAAADARMAAEDDVTYPERDE